MLNSTGLLDFFPSPEDIISIHIQQKTNSTKTDPSNVNSRTIQPPAEQIEY
jgi:hypothetical protein